jgi:16S rRNA processing protein RimM
LKLHPFGDDPASWRNIKHWWLGADENDHFGWRAYPLQSMRGQGKGWVVKLTGVDDRNAAEALVGSYVGAPREALPKTAADEFYWADLIGLDVVNERQEALGQVAEMLEAGAHAVMAVREGEGEAAVERLIPFVGQVVKEVDVPARRVTVAWERDW